MMAPGMTQTQRLRLSRVNPKLLQQLELQEAERKSQLRAARAASAAGTTGKQRGKTGAAAGKENESSRKNADAIGEQTGRLLENLAASYESPENTGRHKRPVPTPRTSKMQLTNGTAAAEDGGRGNFEDFALKTYTVASPRRRAVEVVPLVSLRSSSEEMIQLTLPQEDSEEDETSEVPPPAVKGRRSPRKQSQKDKIVRQQAEEKVSSKRASPTTSSRRIQSAVVLPETSSTKPASPLLGQTRSLSAPTIARDGVPASAAPFPAGNWRESSGRGRSRGFFGHWRWRRFADNRRSRPTHGGRTLLWRWRWWW